MRTLIPQELNYVITSTVLDAILHTLLSTVTIFVFHVRIMNNLLKSLLLTKLAGVPEVVLAYCLLSFGSIVFDEVFPLWAMATPVKVGYTTQY